jgi:hypothetical protein
MPQQLPQGFQIHRLDQMVVEAGEPTPVAVLLFP